MLGRLIQPELDELIERHEWRMLRDVLVDLSVADVADVLSEIAAKHSALVFRLLPREVATDVFEHMDADEQEVLLDSLRDVEAARLLNDMSPDDRTELLEEMPDRVARRVIRLLSPSERVLAQSLLAYPEDSVGRLMTPEYVKVKSRSTAAQCIELLRRVAKDMETVYYLYVVDDQNVPVGVVSLAEVVCSPPDAEVGALLGEKDDLVTIRADDDQWEAVRMIGHYDLFALPVVDSRGRIVGIVTVDDLMDVQEEEATEDMQMMSGVVPTEGAYLSSRIRELLPKRLVSLIMLAITATLMGLVILFYEGRLEDKANSLTLFIIVVMAASGNTGGQAGTLIIRALAVEEINRRRLMFVGAREAVIGTLLGVAVGAVVGVLGFFAYDISVAEMQVIGGALVAALFLCNMFGAMLPIGLKAIGLDPAFFSTPLITTVSDLIALFTLFQFALWFL